jgi:hypothetical protein
MNFSSLNLKLSSLGIVFILSLSTNFLKAQTEQIGRVEVSLEDEWGDFFVIPMKENGVILGSFGDKEDGMIPVKFSWYGADLNKQTEQIVKVPKSFEHVGTYLGTDAAYVLFYDYKKGHYMNYKLAYGSNEAEILEGAIADDMYVKNFIVLNKTMFVLLHDKKKASISIIDLDEGSERRVELHENKDKIEAINIELVKPGDEVHIFYHSCGDECKNLIKRFDKEGNEIGKDLVVKSKGKDYVMNVTSSKVSDDRTFVIAAYGAHSDNYASGFMVGLYDAGAKATFTQRYNFLDLEHFTDYLPESTKRRIEKKQDKKEKQGKELEIDYLMQLHQVKQLPDNKFLVAGEFYYPTYRTEYYTTYTNGRAVTSTRQVFDGFQYTHSLLAVFDETGQKVWSNIFPMFLDQKPFIARKNLRITVEGEQITCMFANYKSIVSTTFENGEILKERNRETVLTEKLGETIRAASGTDIVFWYPKHYLTSGYQKIKSEEKDKNGKKRRRVFFMTDVVYEVE